MRVIEFPGGETLSKRGLKRDKPKSQHQMLIGSATFTCPGCANKTSIDTKGMIFKIIEFYCSSCGKPHRLVNPAFTEDTRK